MDKVLQHLVDEYKREIDLYTIPTCENCGITLFGEEQPAYAFDFSKVERLCKECYYKEMRERERERKRRDSLPICCTDHCSGIA